MNNRSVFNLKCSAFTAVFGLGILGVVFLVGIYLDRMGPARILILLLVAGSGWFLPPVWSLGTGVTAVVGDLVMAPTLNSLTFLLWASYIGFPHLVSQSQTIRGSSSPSGDTVRDSAPGTSSAKTVREQGTPPGDEQVSNQLMELFTRHFRRARTELEADNLLYFHVRDGTAHLGYLIHDEGTIRKDKTLSDRSGQGVGWVIRHGEELILKRRQIDWRNLQYHGRAIELQRVHMTPIHHQDALIGVLVLEWVEEPDEERLSSLDDLIEEIGLFMNVDRTLREWSRVQNRYQLLEEILRVNPLEEESFEGIVHRCRDLVEQYMPADDIDFYRPGETASRKVVNRREVLFRRCFEWLEQGHRSLCLTNVQEQSLGNKPLSRFAPPDIGSLLAGRVGEKDRDGEGLMIVLTHGQDGFFTENDQQLLESILRYLKQMVRVGETLQEQREDRRREGAVLEAYQQCLDRDRFASRTECLVTRLRDHLPVAGVSLHWKLSDRFECVEYAGPDPAPSGLSSDQPFLRRLRDADTDSTVGFPERRHISGMECAESIQAARVVPIRDGVDTLRGFLTFLFDSPSGLRDSFNDRIETLAPIIRDTLLQMDERRQMEQRLGTDPISELPTFDEWKREVSSRVRERKPSRITLWQMQAPGLEEIGERSGREGLRRWLRRLTDTLVEGMDRSLVCRAYLGCFYGFSTEASDRVESRLVVIVEDLEEWSFPGGSWPKQPVAQVRSFSTPLPDVDQMLQGLDYTPARRE